MPTGSIYGIFYTVWYVNLFDR